VGDLDLAWEWKQKVGELNRLHKEVQQKPDSVKRGYISCPGGILNAYREGDINFEEAVKSLENWKASELAEFKGSMKAVAEDMIELHSRM